MIPLASVVVCRNASENPAGIETCHNPICAVIRNCSRNASENPAGIETVLLGAMRCNSQRVATHQKTQQGLKPLTGLVCCAGFLQCRNASENPAGIETEANGAAMRRKSMNRNASENPAGIETRRSWH